MLRAKIISSGFSYCTGDDNYGGGLVAPLSAGIIYGQYGRFFLCCNTIYEAVIQKLWERVDSIGNVERLNKERKTAKL